MFGARIHLQKHVNPAGPQPRWVCAARARQARRRMLAHATAATKSAAAAAHVLAMDAETPSTSGSSDGRRRGSPQQQRTAGGKQQLRWDYKYQRFPCASPVRPDDLRCLQAEALFQNVLGYPRLPQRIYVYLQRHPELTVDAVTATVEGLDARFGKELVLYMLMRSPWILSFTIDQLAANAEATRTLLDLKGSDMFMVLRKNPSLLTMDPIEVRNRYNALPRVTPLSNEDVRTMVRKYPLVLSKATEMLARIMERLRNLAYMRAMWQQDFEVISPSLLAFFLRDWGDLVLRMEYLVLTGDSPQLTLYEVFKPSNNLFQRKHRGFRAWLAKRQARRQQLQMRAQQRAQEMQQQGPAGIGRSDGTRPNSDVP